MKHALMNPAYPDVVREWAAEHPERRRGAGFKARVAALFASLPTVKMLDAIRVS